jgi:hypothetical protein
LYYAAGTLKYGVVMQTTDPAVRWMVAKILEVSDETGQIPNPWAFRQQVPGPGYWKTEFALPQECNPHGDFMLVRSVHWGMDAGMEVNTEFDSASKSVPCPANSSGGSGSGEGEDLYVNQGPAGEWMCREFNLEEGTYQVYVDFVYAGSISCDS